MLQREVRLGYVQVAAGGLQSTEAPRLRVNEAQAAVRLELSARWLSLTFPLASDQAREGNNIIESQHARQWAGECITMIALPFS